MLNLGQTTLIVTQQLVRAAPTETPVEPKAPPAPRREPPPATPSVPDDEPLVKPAETPAPTPTPCKPGQTPEWPVCVLQQASLPANWRN